MIFIHHNGKPYISLTEKPEITDDKYRPSRKMYLAGLKFNIGLFESDLNSWQSSLIPVEEGSVANLSNYLYNIHLKQTAGNHDSFGKAREQGIPISEEVVRITNACIMHDNVEPIHCGCDLPDEMYNVAVFVPPTKSVKETKLTKLPALDIEYNKETKEWTACLAGTGIVVSGDSKNKTIDELLTSVKVQLLYDAGIKYESVKETSEAVTFEAFKESLEWLRDNADMDSEDKWFVYSDKSQVTIERLYELFKQNSQLQGNN